jgi:transposase
MDALAAAAAAAGSPVAAPPPSEQRLTEEQRWTVIVYKKDGKSTSWIARRLEVARSSVRAVWTRYQATGSPGSGSRSGRPRCTDEATDTAIAFVAHVDVFTSPRRIRRKLELDDVSARTIDRRLQEAGLYGRVARHKRDYSDVEIRKRMSFAEGYADWTVAAWSRVIFSDEKSFYGRGWCGQMWVRRPIGAALDPKYCAHSVAHPALVGMWGCFSAAGPGYIRTYNGTVNAIIMKDILSENLVATAEEHSLMEPRAPQWYFLHDNAPTFNNALVRAWLHNKGIACLDLPPYSPDLNPIENLWSWFSNRIDVGDCSTVEKLQDRIAEEWEKMRDNKDALEYMQELVASMPRRCQAVIAAKGWHTKY